MTLRVTTVRITNPTRQEFLHTALRHIPTPSGELWLARLCEQPGTGVWELLVAGPGDVAACEGWEVARADDARFRFRALLTTRADQSADGVRRRVRRLAWNGIRFSVNAGGRENPAIAQTFEDAVWEVAVAADVSALEVRLNFFSPAAGQLHCYCEVEAPAAAGELRPWRFWCPLVRTPRELGMALAAALVARRGEPDRLLEELFFASNAEATPRPLHSDGAHPLESLLPADEECTQGATHFL